MTKSIDATIKDKRADGRGLGHRKEYKPWIQAVSVKSQGNKTRWIGQITDREHQVLSTLEYHVGNIMDFSCQVKDIREQFPLWPIEETLEIAQSLGVEHPYKQQKGKSAKYIVMTTDFLIDVAIEKTIIQVARAIKLHGDLDERRVLEKLEIERIYWERHDVDWGIITDLDYNKDLAVNISDVLRHHQIIENRMHISATEIERLSRELTQMVKHRNEPLSILLRELEKENNIPKGEAISLPWYLIANRRWVVDLDKPLNASQKLTIISDNFS